MKILLLLRLTIYFLLIGAICIPLKYISVDLQITLLITIILLVVCAELIRE